MVKKRKIIQKFFGERIVPFNLNVYSWVTLENSGLRIRRPDEHDLNSIRIDVNLREEEVTDPQDSLSVLKVYAVPIDLSFKCLEELEKANRGRMVRCFVSFELVQPPK